ncbi:FAD-binding oxidoreductase [Geminocystis sp. CENA526]|uniref:FAD-binding oxidoreductase n=1 Tax=Geminocystis sp. CENA526 TaxID=1355871 RepID=UPI003D7014A1
MNTNFLIPSLTQIQEKVRNINDEPLEILPWEQIEPWKNRISQLKIKSGIPSYLIIPNTKDMLSQFLNVCDEHLYPIFPLGNGSKISWGKLPPQAKIFVSTQKLDRIVDHAVEDLTVTVESGMTLKNLQNFLRLQNQFLPIDPCFPESATIGGIIATANTGSWRQRYGGVRDLLLGISFMRGDGKEAKAGGRVVKNVAGYDLMKLFTGSYGNLGIITEATFRLFPLPENSLTVMVTGEKESIYQLQKTVSASGLTPTAMDLCSKSLVKSHDLGTGFGLIFRFQGITESIKQQSSQVQNIAEKFDLSTKIYQNQEELNLWENLPLKTYQGDVICKVGILPSQALNLLDKFDNNGLINVSQGIGFLSFMNDIKSHQILNVRQFCTENSGFLTILKAPFKEQIEPWGYVGNGLPMMKTIKHNFDPRGVFIDRL